MLHSKHTALHIISRHMFRPWSVHLQALGHSALAAPDCSCVLMVWGLGSCMQLLLARWVVGVVVGGGGRGGRNGSGTASGDS